MNFWKVTGRCSNNETEHLLCIFWTLINITENVMLSSFCDASFTQWGHLLGPVTGVPVEFDLDGAPGVWVEWLLKQLLHLVWNLKIYTAFEKKKNKKKPSTDRVNYLVLMYLCTDPSMCFTALTLVMWKSNADVPSCASIRHAASSSEIDCIKDKWYWTVPNWRADVWTMCLII